MGGNRWQDMAICGIREATGGPHSPVGCRLSARPLRQPSFDCQPRPTCGEGRMRRRGEHLHARHVAPAELRLPATPYLTYLCRVHIYRRLPFPPSHGTRRRGRGVMSRVGRRGRCGGVLAGLVLLGRPAEQPQLLRVLLVAHAMDLTKLGELQPLLLAHHAAREHSVQHRGVPVVVDGCGGARRGGREGSRRGGRGGSRRGGRSGSRRGGRA